MSLIRFLAGLFVFPLTFLFVFGAAQLLAMEFGKAVSGFIGSSNLAALSYILGSVLFGLALAVVAAYASAKFISGLLTGRGH